MNDLMFWVSVPCNQVAEFQRSLLLPYFLTVRVEAVNSLIMVVRACQVVLCHISRHCYLNKVHFQTFVMFDSVIIYCIYLKIRL